MSMMPQKNPGFWHWGFVGTKNPDTLHHLFKDYMKKWALTTDGARINGAVNFSEQFLIDIGTLKLNHGGSGGDTKWIGHGLTIMSCLPLGHGVWEEVLAEEEAAHQTNTIQTLDKELKRSKGMHPHGLYLERL
jgi:hypothetical protein